jgi:hypothetical protein
VFTGDVRHLLRAPEWQPGDPVIERPRRVYPRPPARQRLPSPPSPAGPPEGPGPQLDYPAPPSSDSRDFDVPILNFDGATFTGVNPADPVGDVGPNHYIQLVNSASGTQVRIYDKSGGVVAGPFILDSVWTAGGACASGFGDPVVLYDPRRRGMRRSTAWQDEATRL